MKISLSTNKRNDTENFKLFILFSKMWKIKAMKRADKIGDKIDP